MSDLIFQEFQEFHHEASHLLLYRACCRFPATLTTKILFACLYFLIEMEATYPAHHDLALCEEDNHQHGMGQRTVTICPVTGDIQPRQEHPMRLALLRPRAL
jgi:hypothetical protein